MADAVDLFAGPGGWEEATRALGLNVLGIEWDDEACATRRAAGHPTVQADVATLDPFDFAPVRGVIASAPCQAWTIGGKRGGERDREHVVQCAHELAAGNDTRAQHRAACEDERSMLVVEPLRWALALRPEWVAFEQVPPVLKLWELFAGLLRRHGYETWVGLLNAADYGVPQIRERAVMVASRVRPVGRPPATHRSIQADKATYLFGGDERPWVTMYEALGWGLTERPATTVIARSSGDGAPNPLDAGTRARQVYYEARARGAWVEAEGREQASDWAAMRPSLDDAARLQGFRADYPWQGSLHKIVEQIGNAVPPPLGEHVLRMAAGDDTRS